MVSDTLVSHSTSVAWFPCLCVFEFKPSLMIREHLPPGQDVLHSCDQVSKTSASLHGKHLRDKTEIFFLFFFLVAFLEFTIIPLTVFFTGSREDNFCNVIRCSIVQQGIAF